MTRFLQKTAAVALLVLVVVTFAAPQAATAKKPWEKFKYDDLGEIKLPAYERVVLDNGMVLYLAEDHELPLVELSATIQVGSIYEPTHLTGMAGITGEVLRTGGTAKWDGDTIDAMLESMGAAVETWVGDATGGAYLSALEEDSDQALEILADILMHPQFAEDKIDLAKTQRKAGIARRNDEPMGIAMREFRKVMFGADHPSARVEEYATIAAIERQHLVGFHDAYFRPDRMYLVVLGDFDTKTMIAKIEAAFAVGEGLAASAPRSGDARLPAYGQRGGQGRPEPVDRHHRLQGHPQRPPRTTRPCRSPTASWAAASPRACSTRSAASAVWPIPRAARPVPAGASPVSSWPSSAPRTRRPTKPSRSRWTRSAG